MRMRLLKKLRCPNTGQDAFRVHGIEVLRDDRVIRDVAHDEIRADDDVKEGVIVNGKAGVAYPITDFVLSMLADEDADRAYYESYLSTALEKCPEELRPAIHATLDRLVRSKITTTGTWNREEMAYYDSEVATEVKRRAYVELIRAQPLWHIYLEREHHLLRRAGPEPGQSVLEIGCGGARTIAKLMRPAERRYNYIGTDISLKRLMCAKMLIPEGDFVQASAMRLPFRERSFSHAVAFGVLHHLPAPEEGLADTARTLAPGGRMLIHEPIDKPKLLPEGRLDWLRRKLETYEHSEHDNEIAVDRIKATAKSHGLEIVHEHYAVSALRTVLAGWPMSKLPFQSSRAWWRMVIALDRAFVWLFCRNRNALGPGAVLMVLHKASESADDSGTRRKGFDDIDSKSTSAISLTMKRKTSCSSPSPPY